MADGKKSFGNTEEAIKYATEVLEICQQLDKQSLLDYTPQLAEVLDRMAIFLHEVGRSKGAMKYHREAVKTGKPVAWHNFEKFALGFAETLEHISLLLFDKHCHSKGKERIGGFAGHLPGEFTEYRYEAKGVRRGLATRDDNKHTYPLAQTLDKRTGRTSQHADFVAFKSRSKAVVHWEKLAAQDSHKYSPYLLRALEELANWASQNRLHTEAIDRRRQVVDICQGLAVQDAITYTVPLILALHELANTVYLHNGPKAAVKCCLEAVDYWRKLASQDAAKYSLLLAQALEELASWASKSDLVTEAIDCRREVVDIWQALAAQDVEPLVLGLHEMATTFLQHRNPAKAAKCRLEAPWRRWQTGLLKTNSSQKP
ncbi:hypothetical protein NLI96_g12238 [Meripilus lineatus]|uniref:Uncharacterized protein n=1 Tax=Meripilus lineatus TaxID=2056292 RepID=A0AAD5UQF8_9APHY|nr:hypothetical protein NLI96_g12238 [Physisporinus lineatus]